ncbi:MAG: tripartite tricarboxylate transporter substrate binding protein [Rhizobiales bacterium]|nr:tripartite tricarboxylate transporter substrate binding protein [Hyphomicrobiales bacterium]
MPTLLTSALRAALPLLVVMAASPAHAQALSGIIRFIVGAPTGGAIDPYARMIADHMAKTLGQSIIVENKPGANGTISAQWVVDQPADGRVVWVGTQAMTEINPSAYRHLKWTIDDFVPLIKGVESAPVLVVHPSVPAKTLPELVAWVKQNPGKLSYASWSPGTPSAFLGYQLNEKFGLDLTHVPYRGSAPQTSDLIAGHALVGFGQMQSTLPHIRSSKLRAIAMTGSNRSPRLPEVPTFAELGYPDFTATVWFGLLVKSGTPQPVVDRLLAAAKAAHANPAIKEKLEKQGFDVSGLSGPELTAGIRTQIARWARIIKATGFKAD